jgi:hypothetical protein
VDAQLSVLVPEPFRPGVDLQVLATRGQAQNPVA